MLFLKNIVLCQEERGGGGGYPDYALIKFKKKRKYEQLETLFLLLFRKPLSVFEIKDIFYAHAGCTDRENHAPGYLFICTFLYKGIHDMENPCTHRCIALKIDAPGSQNVHTGCRVHP